MSRSKLGNLAPLMTSKVQDWRTPKDFFGILNERFKFTRDFAATKRNALLPKYWTEKDDALAQDWSKERGYLNPPYKGLKAWTEKALETDWKSGKGVVMLVPSRTDTLWFHAVAEHAAVVLIKRRLKFAVPGQPKAGSAPFPSCLIILGELVGPLALGTISRWDPSEEDFPL